MDLLDDRDPVGVLCAAERERAARFRVEGARRSFIACREALRLLLAGQIGAAPHEVTIAVTAAGKPYLPGGTVSFNVSHSGEVGLIAMAQGDHRLGVDVELVQEPADLVGLAERFFHPAEAAVVAGRPEAFFRCWTRKEAVVKAIGQGLSYPLDSFAVDVDAREPSRVRGVDGLEVIPLTIDAGYEASVAADAPAHVVWAR